MNQTLLNFDFGGANAVTKWREINQNDIDRQKLIGEKIQEWQDILLQTGVHKLKVDIILTGSNM